MTLGVVAKVAGIYRYPVQSVRGEGVAAGSFAAHGMPGDRAYAIADLELGCVAHASRAKKQYRPLITWNARYLAEPRAGTAPAPVELDFGDATIRGDDARIDDVISDRLGMKAAFVVNDGSRVPKLYESSPCHLLTSATLKRLSQEHPEGAFLPERFRPNLYLDCGAEVGFVEQNWMGCKVTAGEVVFEINDHCLRCALTTRAQGDLPADPGILQTTTVINKTIAGMYGLVRQAGFLRIGDPVIVAP
jgi:uncharacterized protein YcbX